MLPNQPPPSRPKTPAFDMGSNKASYSGIISRNIFDNEGKIPEALRKSGEENKNKENQIPVLSNLPLILQGTIVHSNSKKSIASIEVKSKSTVMPFRIGEDIENIATVLEIERGKVILRNKNNDRKEYLEMNLSGVKLSSTSPAAKTPLDTANDVIQTTPNHFEIKRTDLTKYLSDLSGVLQQAATAPRKNANGEIECFRFLSIQPGSIYTKLGFQNGDCIKSVNGEKIDSPAKAMETYMALKNSSDIKLQFERDGKDVESNYQVK